MTTKEKIQAEIECLGEEELEQLYRAIKAMTGAKRQEPGKSGLLRRLQQIQIDAPEDFAANLEEYLSGARRAEDIR